MKNNYPEIEISFYDINDNKIDHIYIQIEEDTDELDLKQIIDEQINNNEEINKYKINEFNNFFDIELHGEKSISKVLDICTGLIDYDEVYSAYYNNDVMGANLHNFRKTYLGTFDNREDFLKKYFNELGILDKLDSIFFDFKLNFINWEKVADSYFRFSFYSVDIRNQNKIAVFYK